MLYTVLLKSANTVETPFGKITVQGGGYDRRGALLGIVLSKILTQDELKQAHGAGLYGVVTLPNGSYTLDGATGERCMIAIAKNSGWNITETYGHKQNLTGWVISKD